MFLLDTNVVSELRRPERADGKVLRWASSVAQSEQFLSAITILELEVGALSLKRKDGTQGNALWTGYVTRSFHNSPAASCLSASRRACIVLRYTFPIGDRSATP